MATFKLETPERPLTGQAAQGRVLVLAVCVALAALPVFLGMRGVLVGALATFVAVLMCASLYGSIARARRAAQSLPLHVELSITPREVRMYNVGAAPPSHPRRKRAWVPIAALLAVGGAVAVHGALRAGHWRPLELAIGAGLVLAAGAAAQGLVAIHGMGSDDGRGGIEVRMSRAEIAGFRLSPAGLVILGVKGRPRIVVSKTMGHLTDISRELAAIGVPERPFSKAGEPVPLSRALLSGAATGAGLCILELLNEAPEKWRVDWATNLAVAIAVAVAVEMWRWRRRRKAARVADAAGA